MMDREVYRYIYEAFKNKVLKLSEDSEPRRASGIALVLGMPVSMLKHGEVITENNLYAVARKYRRKGFKVYLIGEDELLAYREASAIAKNYTVRNLQYHQSIIVKHLGFNPSWKDIYGLKLLAKGRLDLVDVPLMRIIKLVDLLREKVIEPAIVS